MRTDHQKMLNEAVTIEMGDRVSAWLRQAYPRDAAKLAARDLGASPHTVEKWLAGSLPANKHLVAMGQRWGKGFFAFILEPVVGPWRHYAMDAEIDDLKSRIAAIEKEHLHEPIGAPTGAVVGATADIPMGAHSSEGDQAATAPRPADGQPRTAAAARG